MNHQPTTALVVFLSVVLLGVIAMFAGLQRQMIYHPEGAVEAAQLAEARQLGLEPWRDGTGALVGWRTPGSGKSHRCLLVFHGNAGYALHRNYYVNGFRALDREWEIYLFEYPGYGARPGSPSQRRILSSAERALRQLLHEAPEPLYLLGESLGSGVASEMAARFPRQVAGLLLVTPFSSLVDVASHHFPFLPVRLMLNERYDSMKALADYRGPAAFLLAGEDEVVPKGLGQRLYNHFQGPKWLREIPGAGHNTLPLYPGADWWQEASNFLQHKSVDSAYN